MTSIHTLYIYIYIYMHAHTVKQFCTRDMYQSKIYKNEVFAGNLFRIFEQYPREKG